MNTKTNEKKKEKYTRKNSRFLVTFAVGGGRGLKASAARVAEDTALDDEPATGRSDGAGTAHHQRHEEAGRDNSSNEGGSRHCSKPKQEEEETTVVE